MRIRLDVNGRRTDADVEPRTLLSDFLRHELGLTGTHVGCEHGVCGACTVQVDGEPVRSCLMFAVQADDRSVRTVEALAEEGGALHPLQQAFPEHHALQCGFCTPGMLLRVHEILRENPSPTREEAREAIASNLCRCTGYATIVRSIRWAAEHPA